MKSPTVARRFAMSASQDVVGALMRRLVTAGLRAGAVAVLGFSTSTPLREIETVQRPTPMRRVSGSPTVVTSLVVLVHSIRR